MQIQENENEIVILTFIRYDNLCMSLAIASLENKTFKTGYCKANLENTTKMRFGHMGVEIRFS